MRCKKCDYRLWNLPSRVCPECGQPFRPSEFEFPVNSVQFRCPHCNQSYYGTGEKGHLVPIEFECVSSHQIQPKKRPAQGMALGTLAPEL